MQSLTKPLSPQIKLVDLESIQIKRPKLSLAIQTTMDRIKEMNSKLTVIITVSLFESKYLKNNNINLIMLLNRFLLGFLKIT